MSLKSLIILLVGTLTYCSIYSQAPEKLSSVEIYNKVEKLNFLGTALYFAAHPDDENTAVISYMSKNIKARTAYLSLTRGDGGQNRIGAEIREKLGVIRTHELLGARSIDGGEQFFTRAIDFGYSKHPDETLSIWNKDEIMHDVVKIIREFRPDVIINRFDHRTPGKTHGHHTSSAMLSVESYELASDATYQADRLSQYTPWQTSRIFFNTSWWFYGSRDKFAKADKSNLLSIDVGVYYPNLGLSNSEIAAKSRSMHKSQGFGSTGTRGTRSEFLELVKGEMPDDKENIFEGINTSWSRVKGGAVIGDQIDQLLNDFDFKAPENHLNELLSIRAAISKIGDAYWRDYKLSEIDEIILQCAGLFIEAKANSPYATAGAVINIDVEAVNRSNSKFALKNILLETISKDVDIDLPNNEKTNTEIAYRLTNKDLEESNAYWLNNKGTLGLYSLDDLSTVGQPLAQAPLTIVATIDIMGHILKITKPVIYKRNDPVKGEIYEPFVVVPEASVEFSDPVYILPTKEEKTVKVEVTAFEDSLNGVLSIRSPKSFVISPEKIDVNVALAGTSKTFEFKVKGPYLQESAELSAHLDVDNTSVSKSLEIIDYDHIPKQYVLSESKAAIHRLNINTVDKNIAYVKGAGDDVPESLRQVGYGVTEIEQTDLSTELLNDYDVVIMGIRAYNIHSDLRLKKDMLMAYVESGGTLIVQYNTNRGGLKGNQIAPYDLELSRDRVTDENAAISFVDPSHPVLNYPNKITSLDFKNWVQERGLYFPSEWDDRYQTPLDTSDPKESMTKGSLLITDYGQGHFIYSGLSWFRQLPAGVPGAFRLFANMISIGREDQQPIQTKADGK